MELVVDKDCNGFTAFDNTLTVHISTLVQHIRNIEHLKTADHGGQEGIDHDGLEEREGNAPEGLGGACAVDLGGFKQGFVDTLDTGHQHDHGIAEPHPDLNEHDDQTRRPDGVHLEPLNRVSACFLCFQEQVDNAVVGRAEQCEIQTGNRCRCNDIRQVHNDLEEALAGHLDTKVGEPDRKQQGQCDLRDEVADPDDQRILKIADEDIVVCIEVRELAFAVAEQERLEVLEPDKIIASDALLCHNVGKAITVKCESECLDQRVQHENEVHYEERQYEYIAVLCIADGFDPPLCSSSHSAHPFKKKLVKITSLNENIHLLGIKPNRYIFGYAVFLDIWSVRVLNYSTVRSPTFALTSSLKPASIASTSL